MSLPALVPVEVDAWGQALGANQLDAVSVEFGPSEIGPVEFGEVQTINPSLTNMVGLSAVGPASQQGPCGVPAFKQANPDRPKIDASLDIDLAERHVSGQMEVDFTPDLNIDEVVLRLWANSPRPKSAGVNAELLSLTVTEPEALAGELDFEVSDDATLISAPLTETLNAGETIVFEAEFSVEIPQESNTRMSSDGTYMRLGAVFPMLAWEPNVGWAKDPATAVFGEAATSPVADWRVQIKDARPGPTFQQLKASYFAAKAEAAATTEATMPGDSADTAAAEPDSTGTATAGDTGASGDTAEPEGTTTPEAATGTDSTGPATTESAVGSFDVIASGKRVSRDYWLLEAGRDFSISIGDFSVAYAVASAPKPVQITVGVHKNMADNPEEYLVKVVRSLEQFSERFGRYPWPTLTLALTPGLSGGIEFPTHIQQGPNTIGRTTSHEVGHMFFYSLVGNNQARDPWIDEGLASYAEFTFEAREPSSVYIPETITGFATEPMTFWADKTDVYWKAVYAQTGIALQRLDDQQKVDCALANLVSQQAHQIATPQDVLAAFEPYFPNISEQLAAHGVIINDAELTGD